MVAVTPAALIAASPAARTSMYARMTGAGCATLTYTRCAAAPLRAAWTAARIDGPSTRRNSAAFDGDGCGVPTRWTIASPGRTAAEYDEPSSASPITVAAPGPTPLAGGRGANRP